MPLIREKDPVVKAKAIEDVKKMVELGQNPDGKFTKRITTEMVTNVVQGIKQEIKDNRGKELARVKEECLDLDKPDERYTVEEGVPSDWEQPPPDLAVAEQVEKERETYQKILEHHKNVMFAFLKAMLLEGMNLDIFKCAFEQICREQAPVPGEKMVETMKKA